MAEVIGILGIISVAKDTLEIINSTLEALKDFRNADKQIRGIVTELQFVQCIVKMFIERLEKRENESEEEEGLSIHKDVTITLVYTKELLDSYRNKLVEMSYSTRSMHALFGGKGKIMDIRREMLSAVCRISYYTTLFTLDDTTEIKAKIDEVHGTSRSIMDTVTNMSNDVKLRLDLVVRSMQIINYREADSILELAKILKDDGIYLVKENIDSEKDLNGLHIANQEGDDVIVHKVPDVKNLNNTLSVTKFIQMANNINILPVKNVIYNESSKNLLVVSNFEYSMITLEKLIEKQALEPSNIALIINNVARALACMHLSGFVHKCMRSSNVVIHEGSAKLTGFYMSRELKSYSGITQDTESVTERIWLPKERIRGSEYTTSCDVYSFGVMIMELYIGSPLSKNEDITKVQNIDDMRDTIIRIFETFCKDKKHIQVVRECTDPEPTKRLRTCMSVIQALESITT